MPMPVSTTRTTARPGAPAGDVDRDAAALGELERVADEVVEHAREGGVVERDERLGRGDVGGQREAAVGGGRPHERGRLVGRVGDAHRDAGELAAAGLEPGEVQDRVERLHQAAARARDQVHELLLLRVRDLVRENVREAEDGRERRPDLVAHVGQEGALEVRDLLGLPLGLDEHGLGALAVRDVAEVEHEPADGGVVVERRPDALGVDEVAVRVAQADLDARLVGERAGRPRTRGARGRRGRWRGRRGGRA